MQRRITRNLLGRAAIAGNLVIVLWILYNGMDEDWKATPVQLAVYVAVIMLFLVNSYLIFQKTKPS